MTITPSPRAVRYRGLSFLELTVVLATLLTLVTLLFVGTRAWRRGSDRAGCMLTLRNVQVATRAYQNMHNYDNGGRPPAENGTQDIAEHLYAKGYIKEKTYSQTRGTTPCNGNGKYSCPVPDIFPQAGQLYMECSLSGAESHTPTTHANW